MPRALEAPFALVDIVRCSKSRTTVDAGRCSQCSPTNGSLGRRRLDVPGRGRIQERSPGRRWTSSRGSLPKNLIAAHPVQGSQTDEGFRGTCSPATPCARMWHPFVLFPASQLRWIIFNHISWVNIQSKFRMVLNHTTLNIIYHKVLFNLLNIIRIKLIIYLTEVATGKAPTT